MYVWACACVRMGLCMRKRLCMPYTSTYYIHMYMYVLACMSSKFAFFFSARLNASMYLIQCKWTMYEVVSNCLPTSPHSLSSNGPSPSSPCGPTPSKSLLSTSHPSLSKEDPSPSSPFPDCGASSSSTSISAPSNAPPSTTPSHSSSNLYCMHIKYHFWVVHGDRLYQSSIRHRCSRCP